MVNPSVWWGKVCPNYIIYLKDRQIMNKLEIAYRWTRPWSRPWDLKKEQLTNSVGLGLVFPLTEF